jgi:GxxExxY protein
MLHEETTSKILQSAIAVHKALGPGLLESAYQACLAHEMRKQGLAALQEDAVPVQYDGVTIDCGFRIDFVVEGSVVVELKAVDGLHAIHDAQLLTYLKLTGIRVGLLLNFNATSIPKGMRRLVR